MRRATRSLLLLPLLWHCSAPRPPNTARVEPPALSLPSAGNVSLKAAPKALPKKPPQKPALSAEAARHALNRFTFGATSGEVGRLVTLGFEHWFEEQLVTASTASPDLENALSPYRSALTPPRELVESWLGEDFSSGVFAVKGLNQRIAPFFKDHLARLAMSQVTRHVLSERQLEEVMVDFWSNHFNVFARKGLVRIFAADYIERALRPNALGNFPDLLAATARHPAMLVYLDNAQSRAERPHDADPGARRKGLNENYARELLELHTLGINGGYAQTDVTDVARVLTGWTIQRDGPAALGFSFKKQNHDGQPKTILGVQFPGGEGEEEGSRLLALLAMHPATARHLATKLCARFVSDAPPPSCISAAEQAYLASRGSIPSVLRAIAHEPAFWAVTSRSSKLKTPLEFLVSALRALGARPDGTTELARELARLGEPLLEESVPTGYPDSEPEWSSSSGLLSRMSLASSLGFGRAKGVVPGPAELFVVSADESEIELANRLLLGGSGSPKTLEAASGALADVDSTGERLSLAIALLLGSPDFQRR